MESFNSKADVFDAELYLNPIDEEDLIPEDESFSVPLRRDVAIAADTPQAYPFFSPYNDRVRPSTMTRDDPLSQRSPSPAAPSASSILMTKKTQQERNASIFAPTTIAMSTDVPEYELCKRFKDLLQRMHTESLVRSGIASHYSMLVAEAGLKEERDMWKLLHLLSVTDADDSRAFEQIKRDLMDRQVCEKEWAELCLQSHDLRRLYVVVRWLEESFVDVTGNDYSFDDCSHQNTKAFYRDEGPDRAISRCDPDAFLTNGDSSPEVRLEEADVERERDLLENLWKLLRAGRSEEAIELCRLSRVPWRAAALSGGQMLSHNSDQVVEGNTHRYLWRECCARLANFLKKGTTPAHRFECGIYGLLARDIDCVTPLLQTWSDYLWCKTRMHLEARVERELVQLPQFDVDAFQGEVRELSQRDHIHLNTTLRHIFEEMNSSSVPEIRMQFTIDDSTASEMPFHVAQRLMVQNSADELFQRCAQWCTQGVNGRQVSPLLLRAITHLLLLNCPEHVEINGNRTQNLQCVVRKYVQYLVDTRQTPLVAWYCQYLSEEEKVSSYAKFLSDIEDYDEKEKCWRYAVEANLDVDAITKCVVTSITKTDQKKSLVLETRSTSKVTSDDVKKIRAIEWLCIDEMQREEALKESNTLIRSFLAMDKLAAAEMMVAALPPDTHVAVRDNGGDLSACVEHLAYVDYLNALSAAERWSAHIFNAPLAPQPPKSRRTAEVLLFEKRQDSYRDAMAQWKQTEEELFIDAVQATRSVVFFECGWLVDPQQPILGVDENQRFREMEELRHHCLPPLIGRMVTLLSHSKRYQNALEVADWVVDEQYHLYTVFSLVERKRLAQQLSRCAIHLLDTHRDPLGYYA